MRVAIALLLTLAGFQSLTWAMCCGMSGPLAWYGAVLEPAKGDPPPWLGMAVYWPIGVAVAFRGFLQLLAAFRAALGGGWLFALVVASIGVFSGLVWCSGVDLLLNGLCVVFLLLPGSRVALGADPPDDD